MMNTPIYLGPFELGAQIGVGGMAVIHQAVHRYTREAVAIKIINPQQALDTAKRTALRREIHTIASLDHPNIVKIFDIGEVSKPAQDASRGSLHEGAPWFAMELVQGGTLQDHMPLKTWSSTRTILLELLDALAHAHAAGVIHRDLKPSNVLLFEDAEGKEHVKLVDFGIAQIFSDAEHHDFGEYTSEINVSGTPRYMAPEQASGQHRRQGPWTDLYALGCLGWAVATGAPPYEGSNLFEVMRAHLFQPLPLFTSAFALPSGFTLWLDGLLAKQPATRFRRAADAAVALLELSEEDLQNYTPQDDTDHDQPASPGDASLTDTALPTLSFLLQQHSLIDPDATQTDIEGLTDMLQVDQVTGHANRVKLSIPEQWERPQPVKPLPMAAASLGLFGLRTPPLIGREAERDVMWGLLRKAAQERSPHLLLLHGHQGAGASRLAEWFLRRSHELGSTINLHASHDPNDGELDALRNMLITHLRCAGLQRDTLRRHLYQACVEDPFIRLPESKLDALMHLLSEPDKGGSRADTDSLDPGSRNELMTDLLHKISAERAVLIWLDDLHWGPATIRLMSYILKEAKDRDFPLLVVGTINDDHMARAPFSALMVDKLAALHHCHRLELQALSASEHRDFIDALIPLKPQLADELARRTEGRPGFAFQLVNDWIRRDALVGGPAGFALKDPNLTTLPESLRELWGRRLEALYITLPTTYQSAAREALELAATLGRRVRLSEWQAACREANLVAYELHIVEALVTQQLATSQEQGWSFVHALLREELLAQAVAKGRVRRWHQCAAKMLETLYVPNAPELLLRLAYHHFESGQLEKAQGLYLSAAQDHHRQGNYSQAREALEQRTRILEELDKGQGSERWCQNQLKCMQIEFNLLELHRVRQRLQHLDTLRPDIEQGPRGELRTKYEYIRLRLRVAEGRLVRAIDGRDALIEQLRLHPRDNRLTTNMRLMAQAHVLYGEVRTAHQLYSLCQQRFYHAQKTLSYGFVTLDLAYCTMLMGDLDVARNMLKESRSLFRQHDVRSGLILSTYYEVLYLKLQGQLDVAAKHLESLRGEIAKLDAPQRATYGIHSLVLAIDQGDMVRIREQFGTLEQLADVFQFQEEIIYQAAQSTHAALRGDYDEASRRFALVRVGLKHTGLCSLEIASLFEILGVASQGASQQLSGQAFAITREQLTRLGNKDLLATFEERRLDPSPTPP